MADRTLILKRQPLPVVKQNPPLGDWEAGSDYTAVGLGIFAARLPCIKLGLRHAYADDATLVAAGSPRGIQEGSSLKGAG